MTCSGRFATAAEYDSLFCIGLDLTDAALVAQVNSYLDLAASDIHAALAAQGMCDCTLETWATAYLKKLNIIDAVVIHHCTCGGLRLSTEERAAKQAWLETQYELIRMGRVPLCAGDTGSDFPAFGTAEMSYTGWNEAQIIINEQLRNP